MNRYRIWDRIERCFRPANGMRRSGDIDMNDSLMQIPPSLLLLLPAPPPQLRVSKDLGGRCWKGTFGGGDMRGCSE